MQAVASSRPQHKPAWPDPARLCSRGRGRTSLPLSSLAADGESGSERSRCRLNLAVSAGCARAAGGHAPPVAWVGSDLETETRPLRGWNLSRGRGLTLAQGARGSWPRGQAVWGVASARAAWGGWREAPREAERSSQGLAQATVFRLDGRAEGCGRLAQGSGPRSRVPRPCPLPSTQGLPQSQRPFSCLRRGT